MRFKLKIILLISVQIICLFGNSKVRAQGQNKRFVIIKTNPPGAMVYFDGETSIVGVSPLKLRPNLIGKYNITAFKNGFEKKNIQYYFRGDENGVLRLTLNPKTRFKASVRSLVFPGWGQYYSERKKFSLVLSVMTLGVGLYTLDKHFVYKNAVDNYNTAIENFEKNKKDYEKHDEYWDVVVARHDAIDSAFIERENWMWITGAIWLYNFLDSIFFFPVTENTLLNKTVPKISANYSNHSAALTLSIPF